MYIINSLLKCVFRCGGPITVSAIPISANFWQKSTSHFAKRTIVFVPTRQLSVSALLSSIAKNSRKAFESRPLVTKRYFSVNKCLRSDALSTNVVKDVMLYKFDKRMLFHLVTFVGVINCVMFISISANIYTLLKLEREAKIKESLEFVEDTTNAPQPEVYDPRKLGFYSYLEVKSDAVRIAIAGVCFVLAYAILGISYIYCNNSVRFIILRKGGKQVTVVTHGFFSMNRYYTHDLEKMSCRGSRHISSSILLRVKDKKFSYILDKKGEFTNPQLFDVTVGVLRDLKK